ncbi:MAG: Rho termination factor, N-terminal domain, partial [Clostridiales bacterium]|nr:Rho termination factor, N-terminal domain [Clostridiales bacterium]
MNFEELRQKTLEELREIGKDLGIKSVTKYRKSELIEGILNFQEKKTLDMVKDEEEEGLPEDVQEDI